MSHQRLSFVAILLLSALAAAPANAYVRTMTCRTDLDPEVSPLGCRDGEIPIPIFWSSGCVVYHTNENGTPDADLTETIDAIRESYETWDNVSCSHLRFIEGGLTNEDRVGYNSCTPAENANVVMFVESGWSHVRDALALTSVTYDQNAGTIVDADIELNDQYFNFTTTDNPLLVRFDVRNTVTHEIGHVLGLDHTPVSDATMAVTAQPGETMKRDLHQDDIDGVCAIYPSSEESTCSVSNVGYFNRPSQGPKEPCPDPDDCSGCRTRGAWGGPGGLAVLFGLLVLIRARRSTS